MYLECGILRQRLAYHRPTEHLYIAIYMPSYCDTYSCMYVKSRFDSLDNSSYRDRLSVVYFRLHNDNNQG